MEIPNLDYRKIGDHFYLSNGEGPVAIYEVIEEEGRKSLIHIDTVSDLDIAAAMCHSYNTKLRAAQETKSSKRLLPNIPEVDKRTLDTINDW